jgi:nitronate monooxygenase
MSFDCLSHCGLRDGNAAMGQFCIDQQLGHAMTGETDKGLYFRGAGLLPFGQEIRSVEDLMQYLITGRQPAPLTLEEASA